jgi:hypothetical protein
MAVVAYGTSPDWAQYQHGIELILMTRRLLWPLVLAAVLLCLGLILLVISGKRRAWWLIGLIPILALFIHRFADDGHSLAIAENPVFVAASDAATFVADDDYIVGLLFGDTWYAYPYALLYSTPVVVQPDQDRRLMLMWSPFANRATAYRIDRQLKPRELEIVSMPANALLIYNARYGQFINGLTGRTMKGEEPIGFGMAIQTRKMRWKQWLALHPKTKVLAPAPGQRLTTVKAPLLPYYKMPPTAGAVPAQMPVALIACTQPVALSEAAVTQQPENFRSGQTAILVLRDTQTGQMRAFNRDLGQDLIPRFRLNPNPAQAHRHALLIDSDTDTGWDANGRAVDGPGAKQKQKLLPIEVEEGLYWGVMKFWYPALTFHPIAPPSAP